MATDVEVWAPAFHWLKRLTPETVFATGSLADLCKLCEEHVLPVFREQHVREHERERKRWEHERKKEALAKQRQVLRTINRERKLSSMSGKHER